MKLNEYQDKASETNFYNPTMSGTLAMVLGLAEEAGEVSGKFSKIIRDKGGAFSRATYDDIKLELGDVLWQVSQVAARMGFTLEDVAKANVKKLYQRKKNNTLEGSGDHR